MTCGSGLSGPITIVSGENFLVENYALDFVLVTIDDPAAADDFGFFESGDTSGWSTTVP